MCVTCGALAAYTRETGTIWQICVLTAERSILGVETDFGPFRVTFSVQTFGPFLFEKWSSGTFGSVRYFLRISAPKLTKIGEVPASFRHVFRLCRRKFRQNSTLGNFRHNHVANWRSYRDSSLRIF